MVSVLQPVVGMRTTLLVLFSVASLVACTRGSTADATTSSSDLIGGSEVADSDFPSTIELTVPGPGWSSCTAAKIGPRHILTAGHCIVYATPNDVTAKLGAGAIVALTAKHGVIGDDDPLMAYPVAQTLVHPTWLATHGDLDDANADVAIVVLTEAALTGGFAKIPIARVDAHPVVPGDELVVMGYGCETGVRVDDNANPRLKAQSTVAVGTVADRSYFATPGAGPAPAALADAGPAPDGPSLCPGDSGGPVYRDDGTERVIVGVNHYYYFAEGSDVSWVNTHTRLDVEAPDGVNDWVQNALAAP